MDLLALQREFLEALEKISNEEVSSTLAGHSLLSAATPAVYEAMTQTFEKTSTMDAPGRALEIASSGTRALAELAMASATGDISLTTLSGFRDRVAQRAHKVYDGLVHAYLSGERGPAPASIHLKGTRPMYDYIRITLGVPMHGMSNYRLFENDAAFGDLTIGEHVSRIYEVCRVLLFPCSLHTHSSR
jgi:phenylalanine ammonia-lyase